jgi:hypothetical protein
MSSRYLRDNPTALQNEQSHIIDYQLSQAVTIRLSEGNALVGQTGVPNSKW